MDEFGHITIPESGATQKDKPLSAGSIVTNQGNVVTGGVVNPDSGSITVKPGGSIVKPDGSTQTFPNGGSVPIDGSVTEVPPSTGVGSYKPSGDYLVSVDKRTGGKVTVSPSRADKGDTVIITVKPDKGYELDELTVTDSKGNELDLREKGENKFTFKMPGSKVTVEASFKLIETEPENPFIDISKNDYFYNAVLWAVEQGITSGTSPLPSAPTPPAPAPRS